tara:strand:- start:744 stop:1235 length:492 start_codon:yes stop_codon:yes gene_type:complete
MKTEYVRVINRVVDNRNAHLCSCTFPIEDKHGKYDGYKHHSNWELHKQDHSNPSFAHYLKCTGCGYELAKQYWTDKNGDAIDYINPEGSINHIDPDDIDELPEELKTYRVKATKEVSYYLDVKAKDAEEAYDIGLDSESHEFTYESVEWVVEHFVPEEVKADK